MLEGHVSLHASYMPKSVHTCVACLMLNGTNCTDPLNNFLLRRVQAEYRGLKPSVASQPSFVPASRWSVCDHRLRLLDEAVALPLVVLGQPRPRLLRGDRLPLHAHLRR